MTDNPTPTESAPLFSPSVIRGPQGKATNLARGHVEIEVKLVGDLADIEAAFQAAKSSDAGPERRARNLLATYYDTADDALRARNHVFRIRKVSGKYFATLKWERKRDHANARGEFEIPVGSPEPDISALGEDVAAAVVRITGGAPLLARFTTQVKRRARTVNLGAAEIEVALDIGSVIAQNRREHIRELELELKQGEEAALYEFATTIVMNHGLTLSVLAKADRGFMLAKGEFPVERRGRIPEVRDQATLDDLIGTIVNECVDQFIANWPALNHPRDFESIHQMRVGLRRLRTALALFNKALPCARFQRFRAEAKRLALEMGPARDIDAFIALVEKGPMGVLGPDESLEKLLEEARHLREASYARVKATIADPATSRFVLELREFVARHGWRNSLDASELFRLSEPAADFARHNLDRLDKRAFKRGRKMAEQPPEVRHRLRIDLKNLRYASEFFGDLFSPSRLKKYTKAVARIQESLGSFNDEAVACQIVAVLEQRAGPECARAVGVVMGWCARSAEMSDPALIDDWDVFRRADRFWWN